MSKAQAQPPRLDQLLEDIERKRHKKNPFDDKWVQLCHSRPEEDAPAAPAGGAAAGQQEEAGVGREAVEAAVTNVHVRVELIRSMRNALVKQTEQAVKHAALEQNGRGAGGRGRAREARAVPAGAGGAAGAAEEGAREAEDFYRDEVYARFQALLEGRDQVDLAGIQATLQANPNHLHNSQLCLNVDGHMQPLAFEDFLQEVLGDGGESDAAEQQADAAAEPTTPQLQAPVASIDAAATLVREHTERLAELGILQGFTLLGGYSSGPWGVQSCAGQPDPLPHYIPQPMEDSSPPITAAGAAGGGAEAAAAGVPQAADWCAAGGEEGGRGVAGGDYGRGPHAAEDMHYGPGVEWPEVIDIPGSQEQQPAWAAQHGMAWQQLAGALPGTWHSPGGRQLQVRFEGDRISCDGDSPRAIPGAPAARLPRQTAAAAQGQQQQGPQQQQDPQQQQQQQQGVDDLWGGWGDFEDEEGLWEAFEGEGWAAQQQGQGRSQLAPLHHAPSAMEQQQHASHVQAASQSGGQLNGLGKDSRAGPSAPKFGPRRQQLVLSQVIPEEREEQQQGEHAGHGQQQGKEGAREAPPAKRHVPVFMHRSMKPARPPVAVPEASDAIEDPDSDSEERPPPAHPAPALTAAAAQQAGRQVPVFARRPAPAASQQAADDTAAGAAEEPMDGSPAGEEQPGEAVQSPASKQAPKVGGKKKERERGSNKSGKEDSIIKVDFSKVDLASFRPTVLFRQEPGAKPKWKPVLDVQSLLLKPPKPAQHAAGQGAGGKGAGGKGGQQQAAAQQGGLLGACGMPALDLGAPLLFQRSMLSSGVDLLARKQLLQGAQELDLSGWEVGPNPLLEEEDDPYGLAGLDLEELDDWGDVLGSAGGGGDVTDAAAAEVEAGAQQGSGGGSGSRGRAQEGRGGGGQAAAQLGPAAGSGWSSRWGGVGQDGGPLAAALEGGQLEIVFDEGQQEEGCWEDGQLQQQQQEQQQHGGGGCSGFMAGNEGAAGGLEAGGDEAGRGQWEREGAGGVQQPSAAAAAAFGVRLRLGGSQGAGGSAQGGGAAAAYDAAAAAAAAAFDGADDDSRAEEVQLVYEEWEQEEAEGQQLGGSKLVEQCLQFHSEEQYQQCELDVQYQQHQEEALLEGSCCAGRLPGEQQDSEDGRGSQEAAPAAVGGVTDWGSESCTVAAQQAALEVELARPAVGGPAPGALQATAPEGQWSWEDGGCEVVMEEEGEEAGGGSWEGGNNAPAVPAAHAASLAGMLSGEEPGSGGGGGGKFEGLFKTRAKFKNAQSLWGLAAVLDPELEVCDIVLDEESGGSPSSGAVAWSALPAGGASGAPELQDLTAAPETACGTAAAAAHALQQQRRQQQQASALPLRQQSQPAGPQARSSTEGSPPTGGGSGLHQASSAAAGAAAGASAMPAAAPAATGPSRLLVQDAAASSLGALPHVSSSDAQLHGYDAIIFDCDAEGEEGPAVYEGLLQAEPSLTEPFLAEPTLAGGPHSGGYAEVVDAAAEEACGAEDDADGFSGGMQGWECELVFEEEVEEDAAAPVSDAAGLPGPAAALPAAYGGAAAAAPGRKRRLEQIEAQILKALWEERRSARQDMQPLMQQLAAQIAAALGAGGSRVTLSQLRQGCLGGGGSGGGGGGGGSGSSTGGRQVSEQRCFLALLTAANHHNTHMAAAQGGLRAAPTGTAPADDTSASAGPAGLVVPGLQRQLRLRSVPAGSASDVEVAAV